MHARGGRQEHAVARDRVIHARSSDRHRADARREAHNRDEAHDVAGARTEQPVGDHVENAALHRCESADRKNIQIQHVQKEIDHDYRNGAGGQRQRHVAIGIANLLGDVAGGVPAGVREHDRHEREQP